MVSSPLFPQIIIIFSSVFFLVERELSVCLLYEINQTQSKQKKKKVDCGNKTKQYELQPKPVLTIVYIVYTTCVQLHKLVVMLTPPRMLKGVSHEIFDPYFFLNSNPYCALLSQNQKLAWSLVALKGSVSQDFRPPVFS